MHCSQSIRPRYHKTPLAEQTDTLFLLPLLLRFRISTTAAPELSPATAALACAARELHRTVFQPYATWLKAVRLKWSPRPIRQLPDADTLHTDLMVRSTTKRNTRHLATAQGAAQVLLRPCTSMLTWHDDTPISHFGLPSV